MRKIFFILLVFVVISICYPLHAQARNMTYASDYYVYGNELANERKYEEALQAYRTARSMDERFYNEHFGITYQIGWVLNKLGRYDEALEEFKIAEKYRPEWILDFAIYYNEGCVLAKLGRNEEALKAFDSSLSYGSTNWYVLFNKGIVLARMGRYPEAVTAFEKSRKAQASYLPLLGSYQETAATYDKARGTIKSVDIPIPASADAGSPLSIASDTYDQETNIDLLLRTGQDFTARYQYENAMVVFDRILKIDPGNYKAMAGKGNALANLGRYDEALKAMDQSITYLDYHVDKSYYTDTYYGKAWVLTKQGKYDEAIKTYDKLFIVGPDIFRGHYDKAWVLAKQGKYDEAVKEYHRSLDWENQSSLETQSYTILGPLGTYQDVANIYDKANVTQSSLTNSSSTQSYVVIYQTDFSSDPQWRTTQPRLYYWDQINKSYHFKSDTSRGYAEISVPYNETPFRLEYDISIPHADPGTLVRFGLSQYNTSENSQNKMVSYYTQNVILGEFKSWRAGMYRNTKDGDKTFQINAIDNQKYSTDPTWEGFFRINREESIAIPSFGDKRIYHVVIEFDPATETISTQVTDNLHEKNYYNCNWIFSKIGIFHDMNRLILVAEPAENAYIEGSIDNVVLSVPSSSAQTISTARVTPTLITSNENKPNALNNTAPPTTQSSPSLIFSLSGIAIVGIIVAIKKRDGK